MTRTRSIGSHRTVATFGAARAGALVWLALAAGCADTHGGGAPNATPGGDAAEGEGGQAAGAGAGANDGNAMGQDAAADANAVGQVANAQDTSPTAAGCVEQCEQDAPCYVPEPLASHSPECLARAELMCSKYEACAADLVLPAPRDLDRRTCLQRELERCGADVDAAEHARCMARLEGASCALLYGAYWWGSGTARCGQELLDGEPSPWARVRDVGEAALEGRCHNSYLTPDTDGVCELSGSLTEGAPCPCSALGGLICYCGDAPCGCELQQGCSFAPTQEGEPEPTCGAPPVLLEGDACGSHAKGISRVPGVCEAGTRCFSNELEMGRCVAYGAEGDACSGRGPRSTCGPGLYCAACATYEARGVCVRYPDP